MSQRSSVRAGARAARLKADLRRFSLGKLWRFLGRDPATLVTRQVVAAADSLKSPSGAPLLVATHISSAKPLPRDIPDLVAATPAGLMGATDEYGQYAGWHWSKAGIVTRCVPICIMVPIKELIPIGVGRGIAEL